jgi:hypothetical protein
MAIKIDLLPEYVPLRRQLKWVISGCVVTLGITATGLALYLQKEKLALETQETNLANIKLVADKTRTAQTLADKARKDAEPMKNVIDFVYEASRTGPERAALLYQVSQFILPDAVVGSLDLSDGKTMKVTAAVRSNRDYWRFLYALRNGSDAQGGVLFTGLPVTTGLIGFPEGNRTFVPPPPGPVPNPLVFPIKVDGTGNLKYPVTLPVDPTGAAPAANPEGGAPPG